MKSLIKKITVLFVVFISLACGWDWDTIQMEKQQFPQIHELITGKFLRHSPELYYWRIKHRTDLIKKYPDSLSLYDDLAMAYDKTGESGKAVEIMLKKENKKPGLYETYANLGLFYMHDGKMQQGVD
ncbi:MAG: tetratricopeptide repeat protein, partial [Flavobacteriales bacterium]